VAASVVVSLLVVTAVIFSVKRNKWSDKIISLILSSFWLLMDIISQLAFFTAMNNSAYLFGSIIIVKDYGFSFRCLSQ
jgi:hypothetical protein